MEDNRELTWQLQRTERGFDNRDLWNLDHTIAEFVLPRLIAYKKGSCGVPGGLESKQWKAILHKMIWSFQEVVDDRNFPKGDYSSEDLQKYYKRRAEGFKLFGKYFNALWW